MAKKQPKKAPAPNKKQRTQSLPFPRRMEARINRISDRLKVYGKEIHARLENEELDDDLKQGVQWLNSLVEKLAELPDEAGRRKGGRTSRIKPGVIISVKQRRRGAYEDLLDEADMVNLTVERVAKGKVLGVTEGGTKLFFPRAHIDVVDDSNAVEEDYE